MRPRAAAIACAALLSAVPPIHAQQESWVTAELRAARDNQPRDVLRLRVEYGGFLGPSATLAAHAAAGVWGPSATARLGATATAGVGRARVEGTGAGLLGAPGGGVAILGEARAGLRLGADVSLRARLTRDRYTATLASLDTLVIAHTMEVALDRAAAPGWAGELVGRRESYGARNPVSTAFAWVLAPLSRGAAHSIRAGYAAAWQDSEESNWVPDPAGGRPGRAPPVTPGPGSADVPGRYAPFYTPHDVRTHSVVGSVAVDLGGGWLILDGAYGVHATELAPALLISPGPTGQVELRFVERSFQPYRVAARWAMALGPLTSLEVRAEHDRTAFFQETRARVSLARSLPGR